MNRAFVEARGRFAEDVARVLRSIRPMKNQSTDDTAQPALRRDPDEWKTGDEPMTGAQRSYLKTLSDEAGEPMDENLTKAEASKRIDELQQKTGRGTQTANQKGSSDG